MFLQQFNKILVIGVDVGLKFVIRLTTTIAVVIKVYGKTALDWAKKKNHSKVVALLEQVSL